MRTRVLLVVAVVFTAMLSTVGGVTAQTIEGSELDKLIHAFVDAQVEGDLVKVNDPNPVSPFGGDSQLSDEINDSISITHSSHFIVNPAGQPYQHFNPAGQNIGLSFENEDGIFETVEVMPTFPQMWTPPLEQGGAPTPEAFFGQFIGDIPPDFGSQFVQGQPFPVNGATIVPPAGGSLPDFNQPFEVRIQRLMNPFGPGWCDGSIFEFFTADAMPGAPIWVAKDFAPNDSFDGTSQAHVTRCVDGQVQPTQLLVNNGSNFQPQPTHAMAIFMENTFIQIIPFGEVMGSEACRQGAFITDASNPFQPDNSAFDAAPAYPGLAPMNFDTTFINNPWSGATLHPVGLNFSEGSEGGSAFSDNFGIMIDTKDESGDTNDYSALAIQLGTYQIMFGELRYEVESDTYSGTLEGSGDGYEESITFNTDGSIDYTHDTGTPEMYEVTMEPGNDTALIAEMLTEYELREAAANPTTTTSEPAPTTITSPGDDPGSESEGTDSGSSSPILLILIFLIAVAILAGLFWWFLVGAKKKDPCEELYDAWLAAKKACDEAKAKAKKARADADKAKSDREKAEQDRKKHCKEFPPACGPQASITDVGSGRTLNRDDLFVSRAWAADAWSGYKGGTKSAQDVQDQWGQPPTKEFRDARLKELEAAKKKTPELDKAIDAAKKAETEANEAADAAEAAAKKACDKAAEAKKAYDDCIGKAKAAGAAADAAAASAAGAAVGGAAGAAAGAALAQGQGGGGGGCDPQQRAYDAAKKECDDATTAADKAAKEAADAETTLGDAEQDLENLCDEYPPLCDKESWIEESGKPETRITNKDLHVQQMWAEQVWVDYQTDQITAQEASDRWGQNPPPEFAKDELQKVEDARPLKKAREQAIKDAKAKRDAAKKAAKDAKAKADAACAKADAAKKALDACLAATGAK